MWIILAAIVGIIGFLWLINYSGRNHPSTIMLKRLLGKPWYRDQLFAIFDIGRKKYRFDLFIDENKIIRGVLFDTPDKLSAAERESLESPEKKKQNITDKLPGLKICGKPIKSIRVILQHGRQASYWIEDMDNPLLFRHYMEDRSWSGSIAKKIGL